VRRGELIDRKETNDQAFRRKHSEQHNSGKKNVETPISWKDFYQEEKEGKNEGLSSTERERMITNCASWKISLKKKTEGMRVKPCVAKEKSNLPIVERP